MLKHAFLTAAAIAAFVTPALSAAAVATISPDEFKATFATGKPFTATGNGGKAFKITLNPDGTALRSAAARKGKSKREAGTWRLSDKGYCTTWAKSPERCYTIQKSGDGYDILGPAGKAAHWKL